MRTASFTQEEFKAGLNRLDERDVRRLLSGGALDGDEARWALEWLNGNREPAKTPQYAPFKMAS
jgi:hypothetical protein